MCDVKYRATRSTVFRISSSSVDFFLLLRHTSFVCTNHRISRTRCNFSAGAGESGSAQGCIRGSAIRTTPQRSVQIGSQSPRASEGAIKSWPGASREAHYPSSGRKEYKFTDMFLFLSAPPFPPLSLLLRDASESNIFTMASSLPIRELGIEFVKWLAYRNLNPYDHSLSTGYLSLITTTSNKKDKICRFVFEKLLVHCRKI